MVQRLLFVKNVGEKINKMDDNIFYTGIVVVNSKKNKVLLGKRSEDGIWTSPGGTSEKGEFPTETAIRELKEESNIDIDENMLIKLNVQKSHNDKMVFVYYIDIDPSEYKISSKQDPDEEVPKWNWFSFDDLPNGLMKDEERFLSVISAIQETLKMKEENTFDKQLKMGIEIEMEHTTDPKEAEKIAMDHLNEDPNYYTKLNKIIVDPVKEKMELKEEITQIESQIEAIDKKNNPIEKNPENKYDKGTTVKTDNIPKDKENSDKVEDETNKYVKTKESLSSTIKEFNEIPTMKEKKVYISDPFEAPPGTNIQVGPRGSYFYDTELIQGKDSSKDDKKSDKTTDEKKDKKDKKNLSKPKE